MTNLAWMIEAQSLIGEREIVGSKHNLKILSWLKRLKASWANDETPWCGAFIAHCLDVAGIAVPKYWYRALDYLNYRNTLPKPAYGCVAIKKRKGGGHVCFVAGRDKRTGKLVCLGGNQGNTVCYALYDEAEFTFKWYGMQATPSPDRYLLPEFDGITATGLSEA